MHRSVYELTEAVRIAFAQIQANKLRSALTMAETVTTGVRRVGLSSDSGIIAPSGGRRRSQATPDSRQGSVGPTSTLTL